MKKLLFFLTILLLFSSQVSADKGCCANSKGGRCTGSEYCTACKNCSGCKYCNSGGSCGVCGLKSKPVHQNLKPNPNQTLANVKQLQKKVQGAAGHLGLVDIAGNMVVNL